MFGKMISLCLCLFLACPAFAASNAKGRQEMVTDKPRKQLGTIVLAGVAGAVLGLSTLSFYGRPQEKLHYVAYGAAFGIIGGAIFTTYRAASEPREFYNLKEPAMPDLWLAEEKIRAPESDLQILGTSFTFEF